MLKVNNVHCGYSGNDVIKGISFSVESGGSLSIIGPNGCGKSTLLKAINNLINYRGSISVRDKEVKAMARKEMARNIALMSQASTIYFPYKVYDAVAIGRYSHMNGVFSSLSTEDRSDVLEALDSVGLLEMQDRLITELSGGQLQRVYLARAFVQDPQILLLDEPTNHLDLKCQVEILNYIDRWRRDKNRIVISVLHDLNLVYMFAEKVLVIKEGEAVSEGTPDEIFKSDVINEVYEMDIRGFMRNSLLNWK